MLPRAQPQAVRASSRPRPAAASHLHRGAWREQVGEGSGVSAIRSATGARARSSRSMPCARAARRDLLADRAVVWTTGVGQHQMWAAQWLRVDETRSFITSGGLGTMGFGFPAALGAQMATRRSRRVHRRRRLLPDDHAGAGHGRARHPIVVAFMNNGYSAWCASGRSFLPRRALLRDAPLATIPGLRQARRGVSAAPAIRAETEAEVDEAILASAVRQASRDPMLPRRPRKRSIRWFRPAPPVET